MCSRGWIIRPLTSAGWCEATSLAVRRRSGSTLERAPFPPALAIQYTTSIPSPTPTASPTATPTPTPTPSITPTPTASPTPFSHPLLFPPVATEANVSIGIDQGCVQILDGPCTNMWTYGGTYPGLTIRRPTGETTEVTVTNNLNAAAGELTVHNHGNHSTAVNDGQPDSLLIPTGGSRTYSYDGLEEGADQRGKMQFYHDHRMDVTGRRIWMGLTGMYIVDDPVDIQPSSSGDFDLTCATSDTP